MPFSPFESFPIGFRIALPGLLLIAGLQAGPCGAEKDAFANEAPPADLTQIQGQVPAPNGERDLTTSDATYTRTSDRIEEADFSLRYRNHRRDLFWSYPSEEVVGWDYGFETRFYTGTSASEQYQGARLTALGSRKFSKALLLESELGGTFLQNHTARFDASAAVARLSADWIPFENAAVRAGISRDSVFQELGLVGEVSPRLTAITAEAALNYRILEPLRASFKGSRRGLTDGNRRTAWDAALMYGISTGTPWIWAGLGIEGLGYSSRVRGYWSPESFSSYGPRIEAAVPLSESWSFNAGLNLNRFREEQLAFGNGYYGSLKLQYGSRDAMSVSGGYMRILSRQISGEWLSQSYLLNLTTPL